MKKMRNGRRGFTLLEIVIVVAIIVILSTGAFLGVAATVNRASDAQARLEADNGENFEAYARNQVNSYGKNMVYWDPIPNYTPENQAKKMKEQMLAEGWTDGEITFEYQTDGWHIVAEWDPTLEEHRGFQTPEDYKLW
ncbi:MAG: prepilin-type N-terminal cleavage/methylation domain-containing protein, partial [Clostridiales bacterium]|nr:prepilin-type N-terminal cleavage/methylation domain-containing protein [Clostridiales bacterium]